jgi:uncharacterized membrane protein SpoIIM required for sporulation
MDYGRFVRTHGPRWTQFERDLQAAAGGGRPGYQDLEDLAVGYRQVLHDYAVARTRFGETGAAERLRGLTLEATHFLHEEHGEGGAGILWFFARRFPRAFREHLAFILVALALFAVAVFFGLTLTVAQPAVGLSFLGPTAVEGMKEGRLWTESLVSSVPPALSSSGIATNNMGVAITGWAGGALFGLGALYVVLLNGFMLGAIVAATWQYSLAGDLLAFVSAHGPLEITLILVTAAGGLGLGHALVAATDRPRRVVVEERSRSALVLLLGCLPWFVVLGIVEALLSPSPALSTSLKIAVGLSLEAAFLTVALHSPSAERGSRRNRP